MNGLSASVKQIGDIIAKDIGVSGNTTEMDGETVSVETFYTDLSVMVLTAAKRLSLERKADIIQYLTR
ncbi:MAG: hypothetical protein COW02_05045 [Comamonadaceae bacterium CG12_big_fil_rev_8_21_14_0_65_59_15]|nr:MAG: hypothetical protein COW02_05045 [Comamonadaceae bacterium CG12_big_fil_rev_8_21_14_0_65_59_15]